MEKKQTNSMSYLLKLAGKYKVHLFFFAVFAIFSALCTFIPFVMVYRVLLFVFGGHADSAAALHYGIIAAAAIVGKFLFSIISGIFSHIGAFNTLYNVRAKISRHIASINLGFFTSHTSGEIKKVIIEDVERIEKFLAHQIPDIISALCVCRLLCLSIL